MGGIILQYSLIPLEIGQDIILSLRLVYIEGDFSSQVIHINKKKKLFFDWNGISWLGHLSPVYFTNKGKTRLNLLILNETESRVFSSFPSS